VVYLRDGCVICRYSVTVIAVLLTLYEELVSFLYSACSHSRIRVPRGSPVNFFFCNLTSFAICTSTFSKLCKCVYNGMRRMLSSSPLDPRGSRSLAAFGKETYKLSLKNQN
jgi:hypothetical protein